MNIQNRFALCAAMFLMVTGLHSSLAATATLNVGACKPGKTNYATIQTAITAAPPGATIDICPGVYPEQLTITSPLTLQGIQSGNNAQVTLAAPANGTLNATVPFAALSIAGMISVSSPGGPVNISGITLDGSGLTTVEARQLAAIAYNSTSGILNRIAVKNLSLAGIGIVAIDIRDDNALSPTITVQNSSASFVDGPSPTGTNCVVAATIIAVGSGGAPSQLSGGTITLAVSNNIFTGVDDGQGVEVDAGVAATVTGNVIDGAGSLDFGNGIGVSGAQVRIANNSLLNVHHGIVLASTAVNTITANRLITSNVGILMPTNSGNTAITGNELISVPKLDSSGNPTKQEGIDFSCAGPLPTMGGNTFTNALIGLAGVPSGDSLPKTAGAYVNVSTIEQLCD